MTLRMLVNSMSVNSLSASDIVDVVAATAGFLVADTVGSVAAVGVGLAAVSLGGRSTDTVTGARFLDLT